MQEQKDEVNQFHQALERRKPAREGHYSGKTWVQQQKGHHCEPQSLHEQPNVFHVDSSYTEQHEQVRKDAEQREVGEAYSEQAELVHLATVNRLRQATQASGHHGESDVHEDLNNENVRQQQDQLQQQEKEEQAHVHVHDHEEPFPRLFAERFEAELGQCKSPGSHSTLSREISLSESEASETEHVVPVSEKKAQSSVASLPSVGEPQKSHIQMDFQMIHMEPQQRTPPPESFITPVSGANKASLPVPQVSAAVNPCQEQNLQEQIPLQMPVHQLQHFNNRLPPSQLSAQTINCSSGGTVRPSPVLVQPLQQPPFSLLAAASMALQSASGSATGPTTAPAAQKESTSGPAAVESPLRGAAAWPGSFLNLVRPPGPPVTANTLAALLQSAEAQRRSLLGLCGLPFNVAGAAAVRAAAARAAVVRVAAARAAQLIGPRAVSLMNANAAIRLQTFMEQHAALGGAAVANALFMAAAPTSVSAGAPGEGIASTTGQLSNSVAAAHTIPETTATLCNEAEAQTTQAASPRKARTTSSASACIVSRLSQIPKATGAVKRTPQTVTGNMAAASMLQAEERTGAATPSSATISTIPEAAVLVPGRAEARPSEKPSQKFATGSSPGSLNQLRGKPPLARTTNKTPGAASGTAPVSRKKASTSVAPCSVVAADATGSSRRKLNVTLSSAAVAEPPCKKRKAMQLSQKPRSQHRKEHTTSLTEDSRTSFRGRTRKAVGVVALASCANRSKPRKITAGDAVSTAPALVAPQNTTSATEPVGLHTDESGRIVKGTAVAQKKFREEPLAKSVWLRNCTQSVLQGDQSDSAASFAIDADIAVAAAGKAVALLDRLIRGTPDGHMRSPGGINLALHADTPGASGKAAQQASPRNSPAPACEQAHATNPFANGTLRPGHSLDSWHSRHSSYSLCENESGEDAVGDVCSDAPVAVPCAVRSRVLDLSGPRQQHMPSTESTIGKKHGRVHAERSIQAENESPGSASGNSPASRQQPHGACDAATFVACDETAHSATEGSSCRTTTASQGGPTSLEDSPEEREPQMLQAEKCKSTPHRVWGSTDPAYNLKQWNQGQYHPLQQSEQDHQQQQNQRSQMQRHHDLHGSVHKAQPQLQTSHSHQQLHENENQQERQCNCQHQLEQNQLAQQHQPRLPHPHQEPRHHSYQLHHQGQHHHGCQRSTSAPQSLFTSMNPRRPTQADWFSGTPRCAKGPLEAARHSSSSPATNDFRREYPSPVQCRHDISLICSKSPHSTSRPFTASLPLQPPVIADAIARDRMRGNLPSPKQVPKSSIVALHCRTTGRAAERTQAEDLLNPQMDELDGTRGLPNCTESFDTDRTKRQLYMQHYQHQDRQEKARQWQLRKVQSLFALHCRLQGLLSNAAVVLEELRDACGCSLETLYTLEESNIMTGGTSPQTHATARSSGEIFQWGQKHPSSKSDGAGSGVYSYKTTHVACCSPEPEHPDAARVYGGVTSLTPLSPNYLQIEPVLTAANTKPLQLQRPLHDQLTQKHHFQQPQIVQPRDGHQPPELRQIQQQRVPQSPHTDQTPQQESLQRQTPQTTQTQHAQEHAFEQQRMFDTQMHFQGHTQPQIIQPEQPHQLPSQQEPLQQPAIQNHMHHQGLLQRQSYLHLQATEPEPLQQYQEPFQQSAFGQPSMHPAMMDERRLQDTRMLQQPVLPHQRFPQPQKKPELIQQQQKERKQRQLTQSVMQNLTPEQQVLMQRHPPTRQVVSLMEGQTATQQQMMPLHEGCSDQQEGGLQQTRQEFQHSIPYQEATRLLLHHEVPACLEHDQRHKRILEQQSVLQPDFEDAMQQPAQELVQGSDGSPLYYKASWSKQSGTGYPGQVLQGLLETPCQFINADIDESAQMNGLKSSCFGSSTPWTSVGGSGSTKSSNTVSAPPSTGDDGNAEEVDSSCSACSASPGNQNSRSSVSDMHLVATDTEKHGVRKEGRATKWHNGKATTSLGARYI
ncbi:hypothetical protein cyc_08185 [Cyclospora cayetanensis]|uniref:Uncharacterized protein n=1 Tax=Cyclospora cayetanensis TaxID=88456 RepID=A0A1D3CZE5_9EIME|nr:hypothetical protein cyc_08185 [Cyclospora cayetanensis]